MLNALMDTWPLGLALFGLVVAFIIFIYQLEKADREDAREQAWQEHLRRQNRPKPKIHRRDRSVP